MIATMLTANLHLSQSIRWLERSCAGWWCLAFTLPLVYFAIALFFSFYLALKEWDSKKEFQNSHFMMSFIWYINTWWVGLNIVGASCCTKWFKTSYSCILILSSIAGILCATGDFCWQTYV